MPSKLVVLILFLLPLGATAQRAFWADEPRETVAGRQAGSRLQRYRPVQVRLAALRAALRLTPTQPNVSNATPAARGGILLSLPRPDGKAERFRVHQVAVMAPALAARFPEIQTYQAFSLDNPGTIARLDLSPAGFHAQVLGAAGGTYYLDPATVGDTVHHRVFYKGEQDLSAAWQCLVSNQATRVATQAAEAAAGEPVMLRTFRLAVACTPEYSLAKGNTTSSVLGAIVSTVNRVNGVYEQELAIRLELVANNDQLIFLSGTGPQPNPAYSNRNGDAMLNQNQRNIDRVIGPANYDVGHVFSTGGAGVAYGSSVCDNLHKAQGVSGANDPSGDAFAIDYVAHEMGHQFGASHTFHSTRELCEGANRVPETAYEPGSGTTIMAYAGICSPENVQPNSDPYFHSVSVDQIREFVATLSCGRTATTANRTPIAEAGPRYFIPKSTPFALTGTATDPDNDALTYSWEEFDLGPVGPINAPTGDAPLFRVFPPSISPTRYFPQLDNLIRNTQTLGERLPDYGRRVRFRLVARDNRTGGGGLAYDSMSVAVLVTAGPFLVQEPNTPTTVWQAGMPTAVRWAVAGTTAAPISAAQVDILLSLDGGYTYPIVLATATPNDGTETLNLPADLAASNGARLMIRATGNVFFDISDANFTVLGKLLPPTLQASGSLTETGITRVALSWTDATTTTATYYQLQRAFQDPTSYTDLAARLPTSSIAPVRTYPDELTQPGRYFYRLRACNALGCSEWSNAVEVLARQTGPLTASPNPSAGRFEVQLISSLRGTVNLEVVDVLGRLVAAANPTKDLDAWQYILDLSGRRAGLYLLRYTLPDGSRSVIRLVKE